ncbi:TPA: hypothetical protein ACNEED_004001 [Escherichia coli]
MCELINEASKYGKVNERKMDIDLCCKKIEEEGYSVFVAFYDFIKNMAAWMIIFGSMGIIYLHQLIY